MCGGPELASRGGAAGGRSPSRVTGRGLVSNFQSHEKESRVSVGSQNIIIYRSDLCF